MHGILKFHFRDIILYNITSYQQQNFSDDV